MSRPVLNGVVLVAHDQTPENVHLPPHLGWWQKLDESEKTLYGAFQSMGIRLINSTDRLLTTDSLILYFGPDE
jgi:hypothetical protein